MCDSPVTNFLLGFDTEMKPTGVKHSSLLDPQVSDLHTAILMSQA